MSKTKLLSFLSQHDKGMTDEQLAQKVGCAPITIQRIKEGMYNPSLILALNIAKALGTTVEELFLLQGGDE